MSYRFGTVSLDRLRTCHPELIKLHDKAIAASPYDYGIGCGYRGRVEQEKAFDEGKSRARYGESPHNHLVLGAPSSLATDVYLWDGDRAVWGGPEHRELMRYLSGVAVGMGLTVKLGYDFKGGWDGPHLEIKEM